MSSYNFKTIAVALVVLSTPVVTAASTSVCGSNGYTIVFVNGVLNSRPKAEDNRFKLGQLLAKANIPDSFTVRLGYNPSHLGGGADFVQSIFQAFGKQISTFDLDTMLMDLHPQITTRKILLVGHSQGSFYTNEMYDYLISHGVPKESIAVYNIATPASYVAGIGGAYITSTNDKVINAVREGEVNGNIRIYADSHYTVGGVVASALRANVTIPKEEGYDTNKWGGHGFEVYLNAEAPRIVRDINYELKSLKASDNSDVADGCFTPPADNITHKMQAAAFSSADTITNVISTNGSVLLSVASLVPGIPATFATASRLIADTRGMFASSGNVAAAQIAAASAAVSGQTNQVLPGKSPAKIIQEIPLPIDPAPVQQPAITPAQNTQTPVPAVEPVIVQQTQGYQPGFGGGGAPAQIVVASIPSASVSLAVNSPADNAFVATTSVTFTGVSTPSAVVSATANTNVASTTADGAGNWSLLLVLPEGLSSVNFEATNGGASASATRSLTVDVTPPAAPSIAIPACASSLAADFCLVPVANISASWTDGAGVTSYTVVRNGVSGAASIATSSTISLDSGATTTVRVVAYDAAGNAASSAAVDVVAVTRPLVINEIGWGGDDGDPSHQFVELKNTSTFTLDLSHVVFTHSGGTQISLSSAVPLPPGNFLLIEPVDVPFTGLNKIIDPLAALSTAGEQLALTWTDSVIDSTPAVSQCGGWCAGALNASIGRNESGVGGLSSPLSMERASDSSDGTLRASWHNTDSYGPWLGSGPTVGVWGSPAANNSAGLPEAGAYCGTPSNVISENMPFNPGSGDCVYLSRFISGSTFGVGRFNALYRGDVGTSTGVGGNYGGKAIASFASGTITNPQPGEHFFFAMWESRSFANDGADFSSYFSTGAPLPPHGNYVTIPFTYAP